MCNAVSYRTASQLHTWTRPGSRNRVTVMSRDGWVAPGHAGQETTPALPVRTPVRRQHLTSIASFSWVFLGDEGFQVPLDTCTQSYPTSVEPSQLELWREVIKSRLAFRNLRASSGERPGDGKYCRFLQFSLLRNCWDTPVPVLHRLPEGCTSTDGLASPSILTARRN